MIRVLGEKKNLGNKKKRGIGNNEEECTECELRCFLGCFLSFELSDVFGVKEVGLKT